MADAEFLDAAARVKFFANTIEKEPPACLVDNEGCIAEEMMTFCRENGVSLD